MSNKQPLVDIILLNYNNANDTIECVKSIEKIKYENYRIIIVDNNSDINDVELLEINVKNHILIKNSTNLGFSHGNNVAIRKSIEYGSDYILLLNNDTVVDSKFLDELISMMDKNKVGIGKINYYSNKNKIWYGGGTVSLYTGKVVHENYGKEDFEDKKIRTVSFATGCCMLIPREIFQNIGLLREDYFLYYEDVDFCYRVFKAGYEIVYNPNSVIYHKVSSSTGNKSELSQYYNFRNKFLFIRNNYSGLKKYNAFLYSLIECLKNILVDGYDLKIFRKAIIDFLTGKTGKL